MEKLEIIVKDENQLSQVNEVAIMQVATDYIKDIQVPANYDANNAVKNFCLSLTTLQDRKGNRALDVCTPQSIISSMQKMISLGLNPSKKQGYLIVRGNTLCLDNGAFGSVKIMKDVTGFEMFSECIYEGDKVKITRRKDGSQVIEVQTNWNNVQSGKIIGAYAVVSDKRTGRVINSDIMTMQEIRQSWAKSATRDLTTHKEFPHEMCRKTVESRLAKRFVNTSDDTRKYEDLEKYIIDSDNYVINVDAEIEKPIDLTDDNNVVITVADNTAISTMQLEDLDEPQNVEGAIEIYYSEYKNNKDKYSLISGSYNDKTKKCLVTVKGE